MSITVPSKANIYQSVTAKIIAAIESGGDTSEMPWHVPGAMLPTNAATQAEYRGINVLSLWIDAQLRGYPTSIWASYRQWQGLGAQVRKGEHGALIVFYKRVEERGTESDDHDTDVKLRHVAKASWVFNAAQVEGFPPPAFEATSEIVRHQQVDAFVSAIGANIQHGYAMACYRRASDTIELPRPEWFHGTGSGTAGENYYAVLLHELTHWTGAPTRLDRSFGERFGDEAYAMEELVAELGAAFLCAAFGLSNEPRPDHAAYIASWLTVLKRDSRAIFVAASSAQEAFEHLAYLATRTTV
jgi:antirestriction protein ArdC